MLLGSRLQEPGKLGHSGRLFLFVCFFNKGIFVIPGVQASSLKLPLSKEVGEERDE